MRDESEIVQPPFRLSSEIFFFFLHNISSDMMTGANDNIHE